MIRAYVAPSESDVGLQMTVFGVGAPRHELRARGLGLGKRARKGSLVASRAGVMHEEQRQRGDKSNMIMSYYVVAYTRSNAEQ